MDANDPIPRGITRRDGVVVAPETDQDSRSMRLARRCYRRAVTQAVPATGPIRTAAVKVPRNAKCPCDSGRKAKRCCHS